MTHPVLDAIHARRSVSPRRQGPPGPSATDIAAIAAAAGAAPDHGLLRPWRFVHVPAARREALADLFGASEREANPAATPEEVEDARKKALRGPEMIAIVARIDAAHPKIPAHEQWISVGAAIQNMQLAAEALGWRCIVVSGDRMGSKALGGAFVRAAGERLVGFMVVGTPTGPIPTPPRPGAAELLGTWES